MTTCISKIGSREHSLSISFWLVGMWFQGPLRQYFSLYRAVSQREGERERYDRQEKNFRNKPDPHLMKAQ